MVTVAVDAMGGDSAPKSIVEGAASASLGSQHQILLVGDEHQISEALAQTRYTPERIRIVPSTGCIPMDADPKKAIADNPDASLPCAARLVRDGEADALVSAGNTGALILVAKEHFPRIEGVARTALAAVVPTERRRGERNDPFSLLLDVGATIRVSADDLVSFALMGAAYARVISRNPAPKIGLLSNGSESYKGPEEIVEAHRILQAQTGLDFIGNIEGVDIPHGIADVVVCDGFTGNVVLKMLEGVAETVMNIARFAYRDRLTWKIAIGLLANGIKELKTVTDWEQYGGAPILGFDKICIKAHGRSGSRAIRNAIKVAGRCAEENLSEQIATGIKTLKS